MSSPALAHFKKIDPILHALALRVGELPPLPVFTPDHYFEQLASTIVGQQLSGKAADTIWGRFIKLLPAVTPAAVLSLSPEAIRATGVSGAKAAYLKDLAQKTHSGSLRFSEFTIQNSEFIIQNLTSVHGIGQWTSEMFLIFTLGHPDIFSPGDQGLKNAIKKWYPAPPDPVVWSPYRSYACRVLWKSLEL